MLKVWGRQSSFNLQKVMWLVDELGLAHEHILAGGDHGGLDTPAFRAMNPHGRVPVIDDDGVVVWESHAILRYLAARHGGERFWSPDAATRSQADRWMDWSQTALQPDFLFSFYYRNMLKPALLAIPKRGALNMHGSLLPKYRGRVPVNWAVIKGETATGATLHYMTEKPDAGDIVEQQAVPILPDETAADVFGKVTAAAVSVLDRSLPALVAGNAPRVQQDPKLATYFGGRKPADGCIDWKQPAEEVHNLVRGVAPPYPGAFTTIAGRTLRILRTQREPADSPRPRRPQIHVGGDVCYAECADGGTLRILEMELDGKPFAVADFLARFGAKPIDLEAAQQ